MNRNFFKGWRTFAFAAVVSFATVATNANAGGPAYIKYQQATDLLEQLTRQTSWLQTNFEISTALGATLTETKTPLLVINKVITPATPWVGQFLQTVIIPLTWDAARNRRLSIDGVNISIIKNFHDSATWMLDAYRRKIWAEARVAQMQQARDRRLPLAVAEAKAAYDNFLMAHADTRKFFVLSMNVIYAYIEGIREIYLIPGCPRPLDDTQRIVTQLVVLQRLAFEIRELMLFVLRAEPFQFDLAPYRYCIERSYPAMPYDINGNKPQPFVPFAYVGPRGPVVPQGLVAQPQQVTPYYNPEQWGGAFNGVTKEYMGNLPQIPNNTFQGMDNLQLPQGPGGQVQGPQPLGQGGNDGSFDQFAPNGQQQGFGQPGIGQPGQQGFGQAGQLGIPQNPGGNTQGGFGQPGQQGGNRLPVPTGPGGGQPNVQPNGNNGSGGQPLPRPSGTGNDFQL